MWIFTKITKSSLFGLFFGVFEQFLAKPHMVARQNRTIWTFGKNMSDWAPDINLFYTFQGPDVTWRQLMCKLLGHSSDSTIFYDNLLEMINERSGSVSRTNAMGKKKALEILDQFILNTGFFW